MAKQKAILTLILSMPALLVGAGVFYHFVVTVPQRERARQALEQQALDAQRMRAAERLQGEERAKEAAMEILDACVQECVNTYLADWNRACQALGRSPNCSLPKATLGAFAERSGHVGRECLKKYPLGFPS